MLLEAFKNGMRFLNTAILVDDAECLSRQIAARGLEFKLEKQPKRTVSVYVEELRCLSRTIAYVTDSIYFRIAKNDDGLSVLADALTEARRIIGHVLTELEQRVQTLDTWSEADLVGTFQTLRQDLTNLSELLSERAEITKESIRELAEFRNGISDSEPSHADSGERAS